MLFQPILDFDNKLKEGIENFNEVLKRFSFIQLYTVAAVQPTYLLKRELFQKKILIIMIKF